MTEITYPPKAKFAKNAHINRASYEEMYKESVSEPERFWAQHGKRIDWIKPFQTVKNVSYEPVSYTHLIIC